jgi:hypothetical protein
LRGGVNGERLRHTESSTPEDRPRAWRGSCHMMAEADEPLTKTLRGPRRPVTCSARSLDLDGLGHRLPQLGRGLTLERPIRV